MFKHCLRVLHRQIKFHVFEGIDVSPKPWGHQFIDNPTSKSPPAVTYEWSLKYRSQEIHIVIHNLSERVALTIILKRSNNYNSKRVALTIILKMSNNCHSKRVALTVILKRSNTYHSKRVALIVILKRSNTYHSKRVALTVILQKAIFTN